MSPTQKTLKLNLLHFNDVYHIEARTQEPVAGASRFKTLLANLKQENDALVCFSGDVFNPSTVSSVTRGSHMVPVLNKLKIDVACYGNHDFDFGVPALASLAGQCNFPWVVSNLFENEQTSKMLAQAKQYQIIESQGIKVGIVGLIEKEWLLTISSLPPDYHYVDFVEMGKKLSDKLRNEEGCQVIIALTHMRLANDEKLMDECSEHIDLILGGHDHFYHIGTGCNFIDQDGNSLERISESVDNTIPDMRVIKSGTDFRDLSLINLCISIPDNNESKREYDIKVQRYVIDSKIPTDPELDEIEREVQKDVVEKMAVIVGYRSEDWDTRSESVRLGESAVGNLMCDIMRFSYPCVDAAVSCGGSLRSDTVYPAGPVTIKDIMSILPFTDPVVVIELEGKYLREGIESSVAMYPRQEGRFPQVSGLKIEFDAKKSPNQRLTKFQILKIAHTRNKDSIPGPLQRGPLPEDDFEDVRDDHLYRIATRDYMSQGFDGFDAFKNNNYIVSEEEGTLLSSLVRRYFLGLKYSAILTKRIKGTNQNDTNDKKVLARWAANKWIEATKKARVQDTDQTDDKDDEPDFCKRKECANVNEALKASLFLQAQNSENVKDEDEVDAKQLAANESTKECLKPIDRHLVTVRVGTMGRIVKV